MHKVSKIPGTRSAKWLQSTDGHFCEKVNLIYENIPAQRTEVQIIINYLFRLSPHLKRISGLAQRKISIKYEIISYEYKFERTTSRR